MPDNWKLCPSCHVLQDPEKETCPRCGYDLRFVKLIKPVADASRAKPIPDASILAPSERASLEKAVRICRKTRKTFEDFADEHGLNTTVLDIMKQVAMEMDREKESNKWKSILAKEWLWFLSSTVGAFLVAIPFVLYKGIEEPFILMVFLVPLVYFIRVTVWSIKQVKR